jgi:hypothetical protein
MSLNENAFRPKSPRYFSSSGDNEPDSGISGKESPTLITAGYWPAKLVWESRQDNRVRRQRR